MDEDDINIVTNCVESYASSANTKSPKRKNVSFDVEKQDEFDNDEFNKPKRLKSPSPHPSKKPLNNPHKRPATGDDQDNEQLSNDNLDRNKSEIYNVKKKRKLEQQFNSALNLDDSVTGDGERHKNRVHGHNKPIISSLFKNNPEIPEIAKKEIEQTLEQVFTTRTFDALNIHPYLVSNLSQTFGIERVTAVQEKVIPLALSGHDILVKSQTGSGKTLAYSIPIIQLLQAQDPKVERTSGIFAVIILPTRELALQTYEWFHKLLRSFTRIVPACFMGGQKRKSEKASIRRGINILVTTPQRLRDHIDHSDKFNVSRVKYLVLDEADRLMDLGYETDIASIVNTIKQQTGENRLQTILLSATLTQGVQKLAGLSLNKPVTVDIGADSSATNAPDQFVVPSNLLQYFVLVPAKLRLVTLAAFILWKCSGSGHKILVFLPTQDMVDYHDKILSYVTPAKSSFDLVDQEEIGKPSIHISQLHGNMAQQDRNEVFKSFRKAKAGVLLCTDVGARGLDLSAVDWIVQYSAPPTPADYVHRVGRTARIGCSGNALLFLLPSESAYIELLQDNNIRLNQMEVDDILNALPMVQEGGMAAKNKHKTVIQSVEEAATSLQLKCEHAVRADNKMHEFARKAFLSFVRMYRTYPSQLKHIFQFKDLHLGHIAKSLALQDTPGTIGAFRPRQVQERRPFHGNQKDGDERSNSYPFQKRNTSGPNPKSVLLSEFSSGLDTIPQSSTRKRKARF